MSKQFSYDVLGMKDVSNMLVNIATNTYDMRSNLQSAKTAINNMESLGFLEAKYERIEQIESNVVDSILAGVEDYQQMILKNSQDVAGTDNKLASQIDEASK